MFYVEGTVGKLKAPRKRRRGFSGARSEAENNLQTVQIGVYELAVLALIGTHIGLIGRLTKFHRE
jgi:hypothetical protein